MTEPSDVTAQSSPSLRDSLVQVRKTCLDLLSRSTSDSLSTSDKKDTRLTLDVCRLLLDEARVSCDIGKLMVAAKAVGLGSADLAPIVDLASSRNLAEFELPPAQVRAPFAVPPPPPRKAEPEPGDQLFPDPEKQKTKLEVRRR